MRVSKEANSASVERSLCQGSSLSAISSSAASAARCSAAFSPSALELPAAPARLTLSRRGLIWASDSS